MDLVNKRIHEFLDETQYKMEFAKNLMKGGKPGAKPTDKKAQDPKHSKTTAPEAKDGGNKMEDELKTMVTQILNKTKENAITSSKLTTDMNNMMDLMKQTLKELDSMAIKDEAEEIKEVKAETTKDAKPIPMPSTPISSHASTTKEPKKNFDSVDVSYCNKVGNN